MADGEETLTEEQLELQKMFGAKKKKKATKTKTVDSTVSAATESEGKVDGDSATTSSISAVKSSGDESFVNSSSVFELDPPTYSYQQLLERVVGFVHHNNPELVDKKRSTMKPPQLMRVGTKKNIMGKFSRNMPNDET